MKTTIEKGKCYEIGDWLLQIDRIDEHHIWGFGADSGEVPINDYINYIDVARQNIAAEFRERLSQYEE